MGDTLRELYMAVLPAVAAERFAKRWRLRKHDAEEIAWRAREIAERLFHVGAKESDVKQESAPVVSNGATVKRNKATGRFEMVKQSDDAASTDLGSPGARPVIREGV